MSVLGRLFPASNREAAGVAFVRTFWQTVRATGFLGGAGVIVVQAAELIAVDWVGLGVAAAAVLLSGVGSGLLAAGDILVHGLPDAYRPGV